MSTAPMFNAMASALGTIGAAMYPDTVTFKSFTTTVGPTGGTTKTSSTNTPANVPCRYHPASGAEVAMANKIISGTIYLIAVPAQFASALTNVDAKCDALIAARSGGEPARTFHISWVGREEGIEIKILASIEE